PAPGAAALGAAAGGNSGGAGNRTLLAVGVDRLRARFVLARGVHAFVAEDYGVCPHIEAHGRVLKLVVRVPCGLRKVGDPDTVKRMHDGLSMKKAGTLARAGL